MQSVVRDVVHSFLKEDVSADTPLMGAGIDSYMMQHFVQASTQRGVEYGVSAYLTGLYQPTDVHQSLRPSFSPMGRRMLSSLTPPPYPTSMQELKNATLHELPETILLEHGTIRELAARLTGALPRHLVEQVLVMAHI